MYTSSFDQVLSTSSGVAELARRLARSNPGNAELLLRLASVADACHDVAEEQVIVTVDDEQEAA